MPMDFLLLLTISGALVVAQLISPNTAQGS